MKYNNTKTTVDGIKFDSKREAARYQELKILEKAGAIENLILQPKFELIPKYEFKGKKVRAMHYVADFQYWENGKEVIEDAKGMKTEVYKIKKKLFEYQFGIEIIEV